MGPRSGAGLEADTAKAGWEVGALHWIQRGHAPAPGAAVAAMVAGQPLPWHCCLPATSSISLRRPPHPVCRRPDSRPCKPPSPSYRVAELEACLQPWLHGADTTGLLNSQHLYHFSYDSVRHLLQSSGFTVVHLEPSTAQTPTGMVYLLRFLAVRQ